MLSPYFFMVRARIAPEREAAFNEWYNTDHLVKVGSQPGVVSAKRYRLTGGGDEYNYAAVYEFEDEEAMNRLLASEFLQQMIREYDEAFGAHSQRIRSSWKQIHPDPTATK